MNRRSFMRWLGFGAATVAVPAIAEKSGVTVLHATSPTIEEAAKVYVFHTKKVSLEEAREMFPADQWSGQEILRLRRMLAPPYTFNRTRK